MKAHRDRSSAKGPELSLGYAGMWEDQDLGVWLHKIQLVTQYGHLGTRANTDLGYHAGSGRSAPGILGVRGGLGLKAPLAVTSSNFPLWARAVPLQVSP